MDLYNWNTPNGQKVAIALEEAAFPYNLHEIDITKGHQNEPWFRDISPDGKIPALKISGESTISLFESGAILLYLAEQYPGLHGGSPAERALVTSWTFWQVGQLGPLAGQFGRFHGIEPIDHTAIDHFRLLVTRCCEVLDSRLEQVEYLAGERYTVADIACYPWIASEQSYLQRFQFEWRLRYPAIVRWAARISARPAVRSVMTV